MTPGTHFLMSWLGAVPLLKNRRERCLITLAGIAPDMDGLGIIVDKLTSGRTQYYFDYHHYVCHTIFFAVILSALLPLIAKTQKILVFILSLFIIHLHFLCDIIGSKGPDGYHWPIY